NVELNGLGDRIEIVRADLRTYDPGRAFDLIFSNPPYIRKASGFLSSSAERSAAKHELHGGIGEILKRTAEWLAPAGRACFVYPEKRRPDLLAAAGESGLSAVRLRSILPRAGEPPNLFLIELEHAARQPELMPALILFGPDGKYTPEAEAVFTGP
ncbi:MAG: tRNA1(Val) (adenine(37)-N6)-methyltransferase, partial [Candidatus Aminicenantales bacterium]